MTKSYLKIATRHLRSNKGFSFINIFGLAVGLATCLLIMVYIFDETAYDQHHKDGDRVFRIASRNNKGETWAATSAPLSATLKNNLPEVEQSARLMTFPDIDMMLIRYGKGQENKQFFESKGYYVDSNFFRVLDYPFIHGDGATALNQPNSIVISRTLSDKFFGNNNPVSKVLLVSTPFGEFDYTIAGVFDDTKTKSHIPANYFLSMRNNDMWNWVQSQTSLLGNNIFFTYVKLEQGADAERFQEKANTLFKDNTGEQQKAAGFAQTLFIQPVKDIYLHSSMPNEIAPNGNATYLYILGSIAAFILIIACINFMNLSTARSEKRAKEVGVRKVMGANKSSLVWQFLGESMLMCMIALVVALLLAQLCLPFFNTVTQKNIRFFDSPVLLLWITGLTLVTGLLAGLYPAFYLSAFQPVKTLKGKVVQHFSAVAIRKGLVVFQFAVSACLLLAAIVIWQQLDYLQQQHLGFNKEQKLIIPLKRSYLNSEKNYAALKNELLRYPEVKSITSGSAYPGITNLNDMLLFAEGKSKAENVDVHLATVNDGYVETLGLGLLSGRTFSPAFNDSASIILNEAAVKQLGYSVSDVVGKKVLFDFGKHAGAMNVVGVIRDFNFESLHHPITPYGLTAEMFGNRYGYLIASLSSNNYASFLQKTEKIWAALHPDIPFIYSFLEQDFQRNYEREQRSAALVAYFTIIAVVIACLGLLGLAAFSVEQRTREIGIRKVLGASASQVTLLLSRDFIKLVLIGSAIGIPLAGWIMHRWLQAFAYQVGVNAWMLIATAGCALAVAFATISFQAIRAALMTPVKSLRSE